MFLIIFTAISMQLSCQIPVKQVHYNKEHLNGIKTTETIPLFSEKVTILESYRQMIVEQIKAIDVQSHGKKC